MMFGFCSIFLNLLNRFFKYTIFLAFTLCLFVNCENSTITSTDNKEQSPYLNHSDSAQYVGMQTCKLCHQAIYNTFLETGMGQSFDNATKKKSAADFNKAQLYDKFSDFHYQAFWKNDSMKIKEYRLSKRDTVFSRTETVNYVIGSGQHTNSHLQNINGYVNQMPMTFYTQQKHWDLPPGFENGVNTRFSRKIGLECMSCHNAFPEFELGSENKYKRIPNGIDCERCHGPGSIHVAQRQSGKNVDTSHYIDYSIVNPAKLSIEAQFDICQRCHLQGNVLLKEGKSFFDFKPGMKLSNYLTVFLPKYSNADDEFIMASHADRLKQSACFIKSAEKIKQTGNRISTLKPYKDALTCITCHNPHISVKKTNPNVFNDACLKCHSNLSDERTLNKTHNDLKNNNLTNCVNCHMPKSGSIDIPHVTVHDHYIRKPISKTEKEKIKTFIGLFAINEKKPSIITRAKAYINQYEKFEQNKIFLDSAEQLVNQEKNLLTKSKALIQLYFIQQNFKNILTVVEELGGQKYCLENLYSKQSYDNEDGWVCYRIAEANNYTGNKHMAINWFKKAIQLTPYNLDFRNKYASTLAEMNETKKAKEQFNFILKENPRQVAAYSNLGYMSLMEGNSVEAIYYYQLGEKLDPDNEALLLNLAGYYLFKNNKPLAIDYLKKIVKKNPTHTKANAALKQLSSH